MNFFEIEQYMKQTKNFTIPEIQKKFQLKYIEARNLFKKMEETHQIFMKKGIQFGYNFAIEKTLEQFRKIFWDCILEDEYNKLKVRRKYDLTDSESFDLENWLCVNNYYDFITDTILITKEEFVNRYGLIEDDKQEKGDDSEENLDDDILNQEITSAIKDEEDIDKFNFDLLKELLKRDKNKDNENDDTIEDEDDIDEEDNSDESEDYDFFDKKKFNDLLEVDSFKKRYDSILKSSLMKDPSMTKAQFLRYIKLQYTRSKDNLLFPTRPVFLEIIKNIQDLTEEEFQKLRSTILGKKE